MPRRVCAYVAMVVLYLSSVAILGEAADPVLTITTPTTATTWITGNPTITLSGIVVPVSGSAIQSVRWWHAQRNSGGTAIGTTAWTVANITLQSGINGLSVWATDSTGAIGGDSIAVTYTPGTTPPTLPAIPLMNPIVLTASVTLSWTYTPGGGTPTEYVLEATVSPATTWTQIATTPYAGPTSAWMMGSMTLGTQYCFRVSAMNSAGRSAPKSICATMNLGTGLVCVPATCTQP